MATQYETFRNFYLKVREYMRLEDQHVLTVDETRDMANLRDDIDRELEIFTKYDVDQLPFKDEEKVVKIGGRHIPVSAIREVINGATILVVTQDQAKNLAVELDPLIDKINDEIGLITKTLDTTKSEHCTFSREERIKKEQDRLRAKNHKKL